MASDPFWWLDEEDGEGSAAKGGGVSSVGDSFRLKSYGVWCPPNSSGLTTDDECGEWGHRHDLLAGATASSEGSSKDRGVSARSSESVRGERLTIEGVVEVASLEGSLARPLELRSRRARGGRRRHVRPESGRWLWARVSHTRLGSDWSDIDRHSETNRA